MRVKLTMEVDFETLEGGEILDPELAQDLTRQVRNATGYLEDHGLLSGDLPAVGRRHRVRSEVTDCDDRLFEVPVWTLEVKEDEPDFDNGGDSA